MLFVALRCLAFSPFPLSFPVAVLEGLGRSLLACCSALWYSLLSVLFVVGHFYTCFFAYVVQLLHSIEKNQTLVFLTPSP